MKIAWVYLWSNFISHIPAQYICVLIFLATSASNNRQRGVYKFLGYKHSCFKTFKHWLILAYSQTYSIQSTKWPRTPLRLFYRFWSDWRSEIKIVMLIFIKYTLFEAFAKSSIKITNGRFLQRPQNFFLPFKQVSSKHVLASIIDDAGQRPRR